jgi:hypothetical protein
MKVSNFETYEQSVGLTRVSWRAKPHRAGVAGLQNIEGTESSRIDWIDRVLGKLFSTSLAWPCQGRRA